jgi:hypothetical protein
MNVNPLIDLIRCNFNNLESLHKLQAAIKSMIRSLEYTLKLLNGEPLPPALPITRIKIASSFFIHFYPQSEVYQPLIEFSSDNDWDTASISVEEAKQIIEGLTDFVEKQEKKETV